jgi:hypothetical protein
MKTFKQWAEEKQYDLDMITDQPEKEKPTSEAGASKRAAVRSHAYPPLYGRGQYPKAYFRPIAPDAVTYQDKDKE